jgi:hypothetical protein
MIELTQLFILLVHQKHLLIKLLYVLLQLLLRFFKRDVFI